MRALLERLTRIWVFPRRLPEEFQRQKLYVSPSAGLRYLFKPMSNVDKPLLDLVREYVRPGHTVWDIGANVGLFTFAAAANAGAAGSVVAVEPDGWLMRLLQQSAEIQSNRAAPVTLIPYAVSNSVGTRQLHIANRSRSANYLDGFGSSQAGGSKQIQTVKSVTLDWLATCHPLPDVLKIDVEGAEAEVLDGGVNLFSQKRPVVLCEVAEDNTNFVTTFLTEHNYQLFDGDLAPAKRTPLNRATWSTLAIPQ